MTLECSKMMLGSEKKTKENQGFRDDLSNLYTKLEVNTVGKKKSLQDNLNKYKIKTDLQK